MEVHAHTHTPRKKWTHYFWEFLMLFLAVTLGFFAENIRERYQDRHRINEYMCKIYFDLQSDLKSIKRLQQERKFRNQQCDSLIILLTQSPAATDKNKMYYYGRNATRRIHFRPQDATFQQLKNTGDLRLVEDAEVLNAIHQYQQLLKYNEENVLVEEKELSEIGQLTARIFNVVVFQQMINDGKLSSPSDNPSLITYDKIILNELGNKLHYWKRTSMSVLESFAELETNAKELTKKIEENYHCR